MIQKRNIVTCILLTIITCGIYGIIWMYQLTNDAATANQDVNLNGTNAVLFTIITCGIYGIYWNYKMGKEVYEAQTKKGLSGSDNSILYLILDIIGLGIVNYCLIQSDLNAIAEKQFNN